MKTYIILGMHRSGTSFLAKALHDQDVNIGKELLGAGRGNEAGHFENMDFLMMNERLLRVAGGTWLNPPSKEAILEAKESHRDKIIELIDKNKDDFWGFKDARTSLTFDVYLPHILDVDPDPFIYACFRHPMEVAKSLNRRDGIPIEKGLALAKEYNRRILDSLKRFLEIDDE